MTGAQVLAGAAAGVGALIAGEQGLYLLHGLWSREWERTDGRVLDSPATQGLEDQMPGAARWCLDTPGLRVHGAGAALCRFPVELARPLAECDGGRVPGLAVPSRAARHGVVQSRGAE